MANSSSTVSTGEVITAAQYNDVRTDAIGPYGDERNFPDNIKATFGTLAASLADGEIFSDGSSWIFDARGGFNIDFKVSGVTRLQITSAGFNLVGDVLFDDNEKIIMGTGSDAEIFFNATDLIINPDAAGSGVLKVGSTLEIEAGANLRFGAITALVDSPAGTMTLSNIDALDATTESTIEAAIDTLANLTAAAALVTVGTITTGVWNGTAITSANINSITESQISDLGTTIALVADNLSVFAATTSAQLAGVISDETGSGLLVFGTAPTFATDISVGNDLLLTSVGAVINFNAGDVTITHAANQLNFAGGNLSIVATERFGFDGAGGETYITEATDDELHIIVGNVKMIQIDQDLNAIALGPAAAVNQNVMVTIDGTISPSSGIGHGLLVEPTVQGVINADVYGTRLNAELTEAGSGTHPLIAQLVISPGALAGGGALVTDTAGIVIEDAPNRTVTGKQYSLWVQSTADVSRFDSDIILNADIIVQDDSDLALGTGSDILARNRSTAAAANLEITDIIIGTSVHPGVAANSLLVSNITASGDMLFLTNRGGNSEAHMLFDASAGDTFIYARGVEHIRAVGGGGVEFSVAIDFDNQNMTNVDIDSGAIDGTTIGASSVAAGSFAAVVATTITGSGILSVDDTTDTTSGTTGSIHTDGGLGVLLKTFLAGALIADGGAVFNEGSADVDFRIESNNQVKMFQVDASKDSIQMLGGADLNNRIINIGSATSGGDQDQASIMAFTGTLTGASGDTNYLAHVNIVGATVTQAVAETIATVSQLRITEPGITNSTATITRANTLFLTGAPTEAEAGGNNAIYMPSGAFEVSDGQGTSGEQLASGGSDSSLSWTAASSVRESKKGITIRNTTADALAKFVAVPVYDFTYRRTVFRTIKYGAAEYGEQHEIKEPVPGKRYSSTGDYDTAYVGIMADEAPWAMHHDNTILNPINTFGYTALAFKEVEKRLAALEGA